MIFLSFRFTSFTFIYLVDALAVPSAMIFSRLLLKRNYHFVHMLGGFICVVGIVLNTVFDLKDSRAEVDQAGSREDVNSGKLLSDTQRLADLTKSQITRNCHYYFKWNICTGTYWQLLELCFSGWMM